MKLAELDFSRSIKKDMCSKICLAIAEELELSDAESVCGGALWQGFKISLLFSSERYMDSLYVNGVKISFRDCHGKTVYRSVLFKKPKYTIDIKALRKKLAEVQELKLKDDELKKDLAIKTANRNADRIENENLAKEKGLTLGHEEWIYTSGGRFQFKGAVDVPLDIALRIQELINEA